MKMTWLIDYADASDKEANKMIDTKFKSNIFELQGPVADPATL